MVRCDGGYASPTGFTLINLLTIATFGEHYSAVDEGIDGVVLAQAHVETGVVHCATLALDDVAGLGKLATEDFHAESLAF